MLDMQPTEQADCHSGYVQDCSIPEQGKGLGLFLSWEQGVTRTQIIAYPQNVRREPMRQVSWTLWGTHRG